MFLSFVKNKFSLSNYIMAILVNKTQRAKKVVSDSPGLVDFVIGLVNSVFNLPDGQVMFFWGIRITEELWNQFCSSKSFWG